MNVMFTLHIRQMVSSFGWIYYRLFFFPCVLFLISALFVVTVIVIVKNDHSHRLCFFNIFLNNVYLYLEHYFHHRYHHHYLLLLYMSYYYYQYYYYYYYYYYYHYYYSCMLKNFGGESVSILFERHCLPLRIRSDLIGKPYQVSMFVFCFLFIYFLLLFVAFLNILMC